MTDAADERKVGAAGFPEARLRDPLIGEKLGPYRIERFLGAGGMGAVYLGIDEALQRKAAIKVLSLLSPRWVARFVAEARHQARLDHPNIVSVYGAGSDVVRGIETHYIALKYVEGSSLAELVRDHGPLEPVHATELVLDAARGLYYVHSEGFLHRDVKPGNLLVDLADRALISDFGVSFGPEAGEGPATGSEFMGTFGYASPEQRARRRLDARSDVFSLGATYLYALTGVPPDDAPTGAAPPPGGRFPIDPALPPLVRIALQRMLAEDPDERFANMLECTEALERARQTGVDGETGVFAAVPAAEDANVRPARRWLLPAVVLAGALAGVLWRIDSRTPPAVSPPPLGRAHASTEPREQPAGGVGETVSLGDEVVTPAEVPATPFAPEPLLQPEPVVLPGPSPDVLAAREAERETLAWLEAAAAAEELDAAGVIAELRQRIGIRLGAFDARAFEGGDDELAAELDRIALAVAPPAGALLDRLQVGPLPVPGGRRIRFDVLPLTNLQYFGYLVGVLSEQESPFLAPLRVPEGLSDDAWVTFREPREVRRPRLDHAFEPLVGLNGSAIDAFAAHAGKRVPTRDEWEAAIGPWVHGQGERSGVLERVLWDGDVYLAGVPLDKAVYRRLLSVEPKLRGVRLVQDG